MRCDFIANIFRFRHLSVPLVLVISIRKSLCSQDSGHQKSWNPKLKIFFIAN